MVPQEINGLKNSYTKDRHHSSQKARIFFLNFLKSCLKNIVLPHESRRDSKMEPHFFRQPLKKLPQHDSRFIQDNIPFWPIHQFVFFSIHCSVFLNSLRCFSLASRIFLQICLGIWLMIVKITTIGYNYRDDRQEQDFYYLLLFPTQPHSQK